jgi:hypothetical protein
MFDMVLAIATFAASGAVGWLVTAFIGGPIRRFCDLRGQVIHRLALYATVPARWSQEGDNLNEPKKLQLSERDAKRLEDAEEALDDLACQLWSFTVNETWAVRILRLRGYDPMKAGDGLRGLSSYIETEGPARAYHRQTVEKALRFHDLG